jgi:hypothetical protein
MDASKATSSHTDFLSTGSATLNQTENDGEYDLKVAKDFVILDDSHQVGEVIMSQDLDLTMHPTLITLGTQYEYWSVQDLTLHIQATSPFGTSSGGAQICHFTDPENAVLRTVTQNPSLNVDKVVRQEGSKLVRPRDSTDLHVQTSGEMYTHETSPAMKRFTSYGNISAVVRDVPAAGDSVTFAVTLSGKIFFHRTSTHYDEYSTTFRELACLSFDSKDNELFAYLKIGHLTTADHIKALILPPFRYYRKTAGRVLPQSVHCISNFMLVDADLQKQILIYKANITTSFSAFLSRERENLDAILTLTTFKN